jgi:hypothetical protein
MGSLSSRAKQPVPWRPDHARFDSRSIFDDAPIKWLDIKPADADVIRNVGTAATEDVVRSLMFSIHVLGVKEIMPADRIRELFSPLLDTVCLWTDRLWPSQFWGDPQRNIIHSASYSPVNKSVNNLLGTGSRACRIIHRRGSIPTSPPKSLAIPFRGTGIAVDPENKGCVGDGSDRRSEFSLVFSYFKNHVQISTRNTASSEYASKIS